MNSSNSINNKPVQELDSKTSSSTSITLRDGSDDETKEQHKTRPFITSIYRHPLCHWRMAILLVSNIPWGWGAALIYVLLADHAKAKGISRPQVGQLFIALGATGFAGRLGTVITCKLL